MPLFALLLSCWLVLNAWMTRRILLAPAEQLPRKRWLLAGVWIIPFVGALVAWNRIRACVPDESETHDRREWDRALDDREPAPQRLAAVGASDFDVPAHLADAAGFPWLDWRAAAAWIESIPADEPRARSDASTACRRAWLLHLRDALGPGFLLHESEHALVVSSLEPSVARATADYVSKTRTRIRGLLRNLAGFQAGEKSVLVVFDDEDSYYHYVSACYPDGGEFGFSGGMFIDAGCPHFVTRRDDLTRIEPVIAHELTHSAVAHLALPLWLDEGIAVNTERRLTGVPPSVHTPQQLRAKHLAFWGEAEIQQFWSGESFHRPDDGQLLSYDLARILVDLLAREWPTFEAFAGHASRSDAGVSAAREHLGIDLVSAVGSLLERDAPAAWAPRV